MIKSSAPLWVRQARILLIIVLGLAVAASAVGGAAHATGTGTDRQLEWLTPGKPERLACPSPSFPGTSDEIGPSRRVMLVGDSLTAHDHDRIKASLTKQGWLPTIACWGGTKTGWGLQQLRDIRKQVGSLPATIVVAMGTNDFLGYACQTPNACAVVRRAFRSSVRALLRYVGPNRKVIWINTHIRLRTAIPYVQKARLPSPFMHNYQLFNQILTAEMTADRARNGSTRHIIGWDGIVRKYDATNNLPLPIAPDGVHYRPKANALRLKVIIRALQRISAGPS